MVEEKGSWGGGMHAKREIEGEKREQVVTGGSNALY